MALGVLIFQALGHCRSYATIAPACLIAAFSTFGFSSKSLPYLLKKGEAARKMQPSHEEVKSKMKDFIAAFAKERELSECETDVFSLLCQRPAVAFV
ncbi:MAG: hypothetical protein IKD70_09625 [Eggerthellaceae bacterium]|nr:hypothetical protein [Eggerthellaceae bacterium]